MASLKASSLSRWVRELNLTTLDERHIAQSGLTFTGPRTPDLYITLILPPSQARVSRNLEGPAAELLRSRFWAELTRESGQARFKPWRILRWPEAEPLRLRAAQEPLRGC